MTTTTKMMTFGAPVHIAIANAAVTAMEALSSYGLKHDAKLAATLNRRAAGWVEFDVVVKEATKKHAEVVRTISVPAVVVAASLKPAKKDGPARGVAYAKADLRKVSKTNRELLIAHGCLMPPTSDGANVKIVC